MVRKDSAVLRSSRGVFAGDKIERSLEIPAVEAGVMQSQAMESCLQPGETGRGQQQTLKSPVRGSPASA